eukprot:TRINITY_DN16637_c0_g1_i1.p1 TRINITY_DN16637_c0_g1~~TRINITY_DN16637_c0_g1_i1.p1  ORF type:complete len:241 (+),score=86.58 TRINITY_DN16637_c0_g1_i1:23-745(+)
MDNNNNNNYYNQQNQYQNFDQSNFYNEAVIYEPEQNTPYMDPNMMHQNYMNNSLQYQQYWPNNIINTSIPQNKNNELVNRAKEFRDNQTVDDSENKNNVKVQRYAAGKIWEDKSLTEWPEDDHRIFVGDLGNDTTEDDIREAFEKYPSYAKCKLVKNKRTNKSKGFAFVSFLDPNDFVKALKEMNGKYIKNRPCKLRKSDWKKRSLSERQKKEGDLVHNLINVKKQVKLKKKATENKNNK